MRRLFKFFITSLFLFFSLESFGAGRLNFILKNNQDIAISSVRIFPTDLPSFKSDNLLQKSLPGRNGIYIGPNFYSDKKLWSIEIRFENGKSEIFKNNRLTLYNSYTIINTKNKFKIRQTYDKEYTKKYHQARNVRLNFQNGQSNILVGNPFRLKTKLEENIERSSWIQLTTSVDLFSSSDKKRISPLSFFKSGDKIKLNFNFNMEGYAYWFLLGTSGYYQILFPYKNSINNRVLPGEEYTIPEKGVWKFDQRKGIEKLICLFSNRESKELKELYFNKSNYSRDEISKKIETIIKEHEKSRLNNNILFDEEDSVSQNIRLQRLDKHNILVSSYEIIHQ